MSKTQDEIRAELDAKIPREAVSEREGGGRTKLSYLEGWYVIDRLNKVLGQGNWSYQTEEMRLVFSDEVNEKQVAHYVAKVTLEFSLPGQEQSQQRTYFSDYGYGDGSDKYNPGKAHELAVKEAVTDGLKRCAKNLGMSMGLALYDKTQENVDDEESPKSVAQGPARQANQTVAPVDAKVQGGSSTETPSTREGWIKLLGQRSIIASQRKLKTTTEMRQMLRNFGVEKKEDLSAEQAQAFCEELGRIIYEKGSDSK